MFQAEVARVLCGGQPCRAERRFGWGRANVATRLPERDSDARCVEGFGTRGPRRTEDANPQRAADIRGVAEPHTRTDPELKSDRRYTNLSAREGVRAADDRQEAINTSMWESEDQARGLKAFAATGPGSAVFEGN